MVVLPDHPGKSGQRVARNAESIAQHQGALVVILTTLHISIGYRFREMGHRAENRSNR